jgi:hypothetical protein
MEGQVDHIRTTPCPSMYCCTLVFMSEFGKLETPKTRQQSLKEKSASVDKLEGMGKKSFLQKSTKCFKRNSRDPDWLD